jgi:hypothetical protein
MKKPVRAFTLVAILILTIPVFRFVCEKLGQCDLVKAYSILTDRNLFSESLVY